jgi:hypothetical protein
MEIYKVIDRIEKKKVKEEFVEFLRAEGYTKKDLLDRWCISALKEIVEFHKEVIKISNTEILSILGGM